MSFTVEQSLKGSS